MLKRITDESTSSQAASHASLFPAQEREMEDQTTAISGRKCLELYELSSPHGSSLKTCVGFLVLRTGWFSSKCALIWKNQVTRSSRLLFLLSPLMRTTGAIDCGLLPTLLAGDWRAPFTDRSAAFEERKKRFEGVNLVEHFQRMGQVGYINPPWAEEFMQFPAGWTELEPSETPSSPK